MLKIAVIVLFIFSCTRATLAQGPEFSFDPDANLGIPEGELDLSMLRHCDEVRSPDIEVPSYLGWAFNVVFNDQEAASIRIQHCYLNNEETTRVIPVIFYNAVPTDSGTVHIKAPIAFIISEPESDPISGEVKYKEKKAYLNQGVLDEGKMSREWRTITRAVKLTIIFNAINAYSKLRANGTDVYKD